MTIKNWNAEGGTDGTNVSVANSATSGDAVAVIVINNASQSGGGTGIQYEADAAMEGSLGVRMLPAAGTTYLRWLDTAPTTMKFGTRYRFRLNGTDISTSALVLHNIRSSADVNLGDLVVAATTRVLSARNAASAAISGQSYALTMGVDYEVEEYRTIDTTTTGQVKYNLYLAGGTTPIYSFDSGAVVNLGTAQPAQCRLGGLTATTTNYTSVDYDALRTGTLPLGDEWGPIDAFGAPSNFTATPVSTSQINLAWDAVAGATGYDIERDAATIVTNHATTTYNDTGLSSATAYDYRVRAIKTY